MSGSSEASLRLKKRVKVVKQDLDDANERCDELDFALQDKEDQFEKLEYELSSTHQELAFTEDQLDDTEKTINELTTRAKTQEGRNEALKRATTVEIMSLGNELSAATKKLRDLEEQLTKIKNSRDSEELEKDCDLYDDELLFTHFTEGEDEADLDVDRKDLIGINERIKRLQEEQVFEHKEFEYDTGAEFKVFEE